ncbi:hypothetical protein [Streptomyces sp. NPDC088760]|uniref:hypothetical protein n=1 Tax=Streptomyces sp. NPDC088760 TaxID=3365890 RepID=UPI00381BDC27
MATQGAITPKRRFPKLGKAAVVAALAVTAIGLTAPISNATAESHWTKGCRGYWYDTSGHAYCKGATASGWFDSLYDCASEGDAHLEKSLGYGYVGNWSSYECIFKLRHTTVTYEG